ncbi:hypothetical protein SC171_16955 [Pantoea cypripedii]|uniref:hypothetical protein n=1 Tax=Pantoea cypripedii TaxID=55209 RepID=UPI002FC5D617
MDLKDVLTPLVTLAGVWLAARFTLRNEISKKGTGNPHRQAGVLLPNAAMY